MTSQSVSLQNLPHLQVNFQEIANASDRKMILYRVAQIVSYVALVAITGGILAIGLGVIPITLPIWAALLTVIAPFGLDWLANKCQAKVDAHREIREINQGMADELNGLNATEIAQFVLTLKEQGMEVRQQVDPRLIAAYKYWENRALGLLWTANPPPAPNLTKNIVALDLMQTANPTPAQKLTESIVALDLETNRDLANVLPEDPQITMDSAQRQAFYREKVAQALVQAAIALENIIHPEKHLRVDPHNFVKLLGLDRLIPDPQCTACLPPYDVHRLLFPSLPAHALN